jgi:RNA polymerase sigma factor (sigma-70 family)
MIDDAELLRRYSEAASEDAFAEVVRRHIDFAYASALRRVGGDAHLAKDVTQHVFIALARQARTLARRESLSAWLFVTTRNLAAQVVRGERRRQVRESAAVLMTELHSNPTHDAEWEKLRPVLDGAMDGVSDQDRQAVLLRYYEGKSYADIGARLRLAENTARMRIDRALEKLRVELERRGVTSTTTGLGLAVANQAAVSAPAEFAAAVTSTALASTAAGAAGWLGGLIGVGTIQATIAGAVAITGASIYVAQGGYEVCRTLRAEPWGQQMTIVALTGWGQTEDRRKSKEAGFDAHLVKPVDHAALRQLLELPGRPQRA